MQMQKARKRFGRNVYTLFDVAGSKEMATRKRNIAKVQYRFTRVYPLKMPSGITAWGIWVMGEA